MFPITSKKSFLKLIQPILWLARLSGIAPFTIQDTKHGMSVTVTKWTLVYSYSAIMVTQCLHAIVLWYIFKCDYLDISNVVMRFFRMLLASTNCYSLLLRHQEIADLLQHQQVLKYSLPSYYAAFPAFIYAFLISITVINQPLISPSLFSWVLGCYADSSSPPPILLLTFVYTCQTEVIHQAILDLNENVTECVNALKISHSTTLRPIMRRHLLLKEIANKINKTYGVPMLITNGAVCYEVTWCFYCVCVADEALGVLVCIIWAVAFIIPPFCAMAWCQKVENALYKTRVISNQLTLIRPGISTRMREELREWDIQLRQLPMQFSAKHFFNLNGPQMRTVVSVILTYTVILVQNLRQK